MSTSEFEQPTLILQEEVTTPLANTPTPSSGPRGMEAIKKGLQAEEAARARTIGLVFFAICTITMVWAPMLDGEPSLKVPVILFLGQFGLFSLGCTGSRPSQSATRVGFSGSMAPPLSWPLR